MDYWNTVVAPLVVAALTGSFTWLLTRRMQKKKIEAAPRRYVQELDRLIKRAMAEGAENAVVNARAIVAARNSLRASLVSISQQLNAEIDRLAEEIGEAVQILSPPSVPSAPTSVEQRRAFETIQVLSRVWPAKKVQIEVEIRKLLAELGIDSASWHNKP